MPDQGGQEKTEQPTGKRLTDSRNKGQVAKSMEINGFLLTMIGFLIVYIGGSFFGNKVKEAAEFIFSSLHEFEMHAGILQTYAVTAITFMLTVLAPIFIGLVVVALFAGYTQVGFKITPESIKPKLSKINPLKGFKNILFSSRSVVELIKSVLKLTVLSAFIYWTLSDVVIAATSLIQTQVPDLFNFMMDEAFSFIWKIGLAYAVIAFLDLAYQRWKHKKDLKMSKQEVKDEMKQSEGDPTVKGRIKNLQLQMSRGRMMQEVPEADVVITNPTHYAVALKYDFGSAEGAPEVVAKGTDQVAQKIKQIAEENGVPLHEDVELARALYKSCEIGEQIPMDLFHAVAQILAYIYQQRNMNKKNTIV